MKIDLIEQLKEAIIGDVVPRRRASFAYITTVEKTDLVNHVNHVYHTKVEIGFTQSAPPNQHRAVRMRAVAALSQKIFGEIEQEVRAALHELWEDGLGDTKAAKRLEAMLPALRGERAQ